MNPNLRQFSFQMPQHFLPPFRDVQAESESRTCPRSSNSSRDYGLTFGEELRDLLGRLDSERFAKA